MQRHSDISRLHGACTNWILLWLIYSCCDIGEFGIVYKGHIIKDPGPVVTDIVAIKTLKGMYVNL